MLDDGFGTQRTRQPPSSKTPENFCILAADIGGPLAAELGVEIADAIEHVTPKRRSCRRKWVSSDRFSQRASPWSSFAEKAQHIILQP